MKLVDLTGIATIDLPIAEFRSHLRLGTGFADDALQDPILEASLRTAVAAIEARTGKVLFERSFRWVVSAWRSPSVQALPVAPVSALTSIVTISRAGDVTATNLTDVVLMEDLHRPQLRAAAMCLPVIPVNGVAEVTFTAGFSPDWLGMPADIAQAVLLLAAHYYEIRHEEPTNDGNMPYGVASLIERYRTVRILGGAAL
ncbi:MAG: head-tail connector protein [Rhodobacteraceae bacterium]|nr:head-tail connector protein [Paracoccaceae bacterium]